MEPAESQLGVERRPGSGCLATERGSGDVRALWTIGGAISCEAGSSRLGSEPEFRSSVSCVHRWGPQMSSVTPRVPLEVKLSNHGAEGSGVGVFGLLVVMLWFGPKF